MKKKIIALIACILVAGTVGVSAKNSIGSCTAANPVSASTYAAVAKNTNSSCPINSVTNAAAVSGKSSAQNSTACYVAKSNCPFTSVQSQCASGNCPSTSAQGQCASSNCLTNAFCSNSTQPSCKNYICISDILNCKTNSCPSNAQNCQNRSCNPIPSSSSSTKSSSGAVSTAKSAPSASSKSSTSSTPSTTSQSNSSFSSFQNQVIQLVNEQRAANGLKPLTANAQLTNTATLKSQDMAKLNYFDHTSPTYGSPFDMMKKYGISYRTAGENIAMGQTTPAQVMQGWMNSPGHRANILNASFTQIGVGIAKNAQGRLIWTQQFIG